MVSGARYATDELRKRALALGFSRIGFARAEVLEEEGARLREWLAAGRHAGMSWLERSAKRRADPKEILPDAASVISLAVNYHYPSGREVNEFEGKIARYARGGDYHAVLRGMLDGLEREITGTHPGARCKSYVDSGPVMEKAWAVRSGVGWQGKHTVMITREFGSWVFLATVLCNVEFAPDTPEADLCGACTKCIESCPTGAIIEPYRLDAGRCLSYLTIEREGDEDDSEASMDYRGWIFGCDICQEVCPWNGKPAASAVKAFEPREHAAGLDLREAAGISDADFAESFAGSAVLRAGAASLRRNARIVLRQRESHIV